MKSRLRLLWFLLLAPGLLLPITAEQPVGAAAPLRARFTGQAQTEFSSAMALEMQLSPAISTPGETLRLDLTLTNGAAVTGAPEILLTIPRNLRVDVAGLPAGTTFNVTDNTVAWLPIVPANGRQTFTLQLPVTTADLNQSAQEITAVLRYNGQEKVARADFWVGLPPQASIEAGSGQVAVGQPIQLSAAVTGSGPISQIWDLGDGRHLEVADPVVVYPVVGTYRVTLQAANPLGGTTATRTITVVPLPAAAFSPDHETTAVNQHVTFGNESGGQPPLTYVWDFGDGSRDTVAEPVHIFTAPGEYPVRLIVRNEHGQSEAIRTVRVGLPPAAADLVLADAATAGQPLYGQATGDGAFRFEWDMGDGTIYEAAQINHTYVVPGAFWVALRAHNDFGHIETGQWVQVTPGLNNHFVYLAAIAGSPANPAGGAGTAVSARTVGEVGPPQLAGETFELEAIPFPDGASAPEQLFWYINEARRLYGLTPLTYSAVLAQAAQQHTDDMSTHSYTGHIGTDNSSPPGRIQRVGYRGGYGGEVTYWGMNDPKEAVEFWINSKAHRRILLSQAVSEVGAAFTANFDAPNIWYWTAEFGSPYLPAIVLTATPTPTPSPTLTATVTLAATLTPTLTPTAVTPTVSPTATPSSTATPTPEPTLTRPFLVTFTPTPAATDEPAPPTVTPTATPSPSPTHTPTPTSEFIVTSTP